MGPIDSPPIPTAWRYRPESPVGPAQLGMELIGRKKKDGTDAIYWAQSHDECYKLAEADGWKF